MPSGVIVSWCGLQVISRRFSEARAALTPRQSTGRLVDKEKCNTVFPDAILTGEHEGFPAQDA